MRRMSISLVVLMLGVVAVNHPDAASGATTGRRVTVTNNRFKGQVARRTSGQKVFIVQSRKSGSTKTALMTPVAAATVRNRLKSQGYSAHLHNYGSQGSLVHYNQGKWQSHAVFANSQAANQAAAVIRTNGLNARVVSR